MKQSQVLKKFLNTWKERKTTAELAASPDAKVLREVVEALDEFFADFQVVKRPPKKGSRKSHSESTGVSTSA